MKSSGIIGYGTYLPRYRITLETMATGNHENHKKLFSSLGIIQKTIANHDEDTVTMAVSAAQEALATTLLNIETIKALYLGSESHPYAVKPSAAIVGTAIGLGHDYAATDLEFACKGGSASLQAALAFSSAHACCALAIGSDVAQADPCDILAYVAAAGSAAFLVGVDEGNIIATIDASHSLTFDMPDFWRRSEERYPQHMGRFTGQPAYFAVIEELITKLLQENALAASDIDHLVVHQPNGKFVTTIANKLGFTKAQYETGMIVQQCGNCYSATTLLGLAHILDAAEPNQRILVASFGSGAGGDGFIMTTTQHLPAYQHERQQLIHKKTIYLPFLEYERRIKMRIS